MPPTRPSLVLAAPLALALSGVAQAHTLGNRHVSQLLEINLAPNGVVLRLTVDAPPEQWAAYGGVKDPLGGSLARLHQGLMVIVDNRTVPLRVVDARPVWDLASGANNLTVLVEAPADLRGRHALRVGNANLSDTPNYLNDELTVPPGATIHATSLLRKTATGALADRSGVWAQYEALRSVSIDVTLPDDAVSRVFAGWHGGVWTLAEARERSLWERWSTRQDTPPTLVGGAATAAWLAGVGTRIAARRTGLGLAVLLPSAAWVLVACASNFRGALLAGWLLGAVAGAVWARRAPGLGRGVVLAVAVGAAIAVTRLIG